MHIIIGVLLNVLSQYLEYILNIHINEMLLVLMIIDILHTLSPHNKVIHLAIMGILRFSPVLLVYTIIPMAILLTMNTSISTVQLRFYLVNWF